MFLFEVEDNYSNGKYNIDNSKYTRDKLPEDYVFDIDKSVHWNREQVKDHNDKIEQETERFLHDCTVAHKSLRCDCIEALVHDFKLSEKQAGIVFDHCFNHGGITADKLFDQLRLMVSLAVKILRSEK